MRQWKVIAIAAAAAAFVATLGATMTELGPWYQNLRKPDWKPPDWLFGPGWTVIFALAALSAASAWRDAKERAQRDWILILFLANGSLNVLWSLLFFRAQRPDWSLIEVFFLWGSILVLIIYLARFSKQGAVLLVPYLAWVTFAGALNWSVVSLNGPFG